MTRLMRAEALKLCTTRTFWLLVIGALALIILGVTFTASATSYTPAPTRHGPRSRWLAWRRPPH